MSPGTKKSLQWGSGLVVAFYVINNPPEAAELVKQVFTWLVAAGNSLATFVNALTK